MKLRQMRLMETKMAVQLKSAVLKTRKLEVLHDEEEHEHELGTYRDEVRELKEQIEAQRAMLKKEAAALAMQRKESEALLCTERPLYDPHEDEDNDEYRTRTHSLPTRRKVHGRTLEKQLSATDFIDNARRVLMAPFPSDKRWELPDHDKRASQVMHHGHL